MKLFDKTQHRYNRSIYNLKASKLRQNIAIMSCFIPVLYTALDFYTGFYHNVGLYAILFFSFLLSVFFNKKKSFLIANFFLLTPASVVVFLFAGSDVNHQIASHVYFIVLAIVSIALTGYDNRHIGIAGAIVVYSLFVITSIADIDFLPTPDELNAVVPVKLYYIVNVSTAVLISILIIFFFININHSIEQLLVQKNKRLNDLNSRLDRLFYVVSHDLKSPLNSIRGLVSLAENSPEDSKSECLEMINNRVLTLEKFIKDVTDISKRNNSIICRNKIDLGSLVDNIYLLNFHHEKSSFINFKKDIDEEILFYSDPLRLQIILGNLISNAINYHNVDKIDAFICVRNYISNNELVIEVSDNGLGIPKEHAQSIFNMFYQVEDYSSLNGSSGLGLYIVKETLDEIKGTIKVESFENIGTTFRIYLPLKLENEEEIAPSRFGIGLKSEDLELANVTVL